MEKYRINVLENRVIEIAVDDWLKIKGQHWLYPTLCDKYNDFYDIYLDGERYTRASFRVHFNVQLEDVLNAKSFYLKQFKMEIFK